MTFHPSSKMAGSTVYGPKPPDFSSPNELLERLEREMAGTTKVLDEDLSDAIRTSRDAKEGYPEGARKLVADLVDKLRSNRRAAREILSIQQAALGEDAAHDAVYQKATKIVGE